MGSSTKDFLSLRWLAPIAAVLSLLACYGTLAATAILGALGITLALNDAVLGRGYRLFRLAHSAGSLAQKTPSWLAFANRLSEPRRHLNHLCDGSHLYARCRIRRFCFPVCRDLARLARETVRPGEARDD
jgi:hypothetical protein